MSNLGRLSLLGLFAALGVMVAVGLARWLPADALGSFAAQGVAPGDSSPPLSAGAAGAAGRGDRGVASVGGARPEAIAGHTSPADPLQRRAVPRPAFRAPDAVADILWAWTTAANQVALEQARAGVRAADTHGWMASRPFASLGAPWNGEPVAPLAGSQPVRIGQSGLLSTLARWAQWFGASPSTGALAQQTPQSPSAAPALPPGTTVAPPVIQPQAAIGPPANAPEALAQGPGPGGGPLIVEIQNEDILVVLEMLAKQGNLSILPSRSVQGKVSATLHGVDVATALDAILKSAGFVARREGDCIFVGTPDDFQAFEQPGGKLATRVYRPRYVPAAELQTLIQPLLSKQMGVCTVTSPAETGIQTDDTKAGGDAYAGGDVVVVRDYESVLEQIDQLVAEIDIRPVQVAIEAMILSVGIDDDDKLGVDFELLRNKGHIRFAVGAPPSALDKMKLEGGLKIGFLDSSISAFLQALETVKDTNVIAAPRLMVLNKHRALIQIGKQQGYVSTTFSETVATQSVEFLATGTLLRLRPFVCGDHLIRMEIHPELSDGEVQELAGFTVPQKDITQVTTNVMVRDGCTVILGGLFREQLVNNSTQVPLLGNLPLVGAVFRNRAEQVTREEIIVLITPRIVLDEEACPEGEQAAAEFHRRQAVAAEKLTPLGKRHVARRFFRLAQNAWAAGHRDAALRFAELAVHFDPTNRAAIDLRSDIWLGRPYGDHTLPPIDEVMPGDLPGEFPLLEPAAPPVQTTPLDEAELPEWLLQRLQRPAAAEQGPMPVQTAPDRSAATPTWQHDAAGRPVFSDAHVAPAAYPAAVAVPPEGIPISVPADYSNASWGPQPK